MKHKQPLKPGDVFMPAHPFVMVPGCGEIDVSWRPGVSIEDDHTPEFPLYCDGEGQQVLTVVSTHKPGRYHKRVFYTRQFIDPDGSPLGKPKLFVRSVGSFRQLAAGYRHRYKVDGPEERD